MLRRGFAVLAGLFSAALVGHAAAQPTSPPRQPDPARVVQQVRSADYKAPAGVNFRPVTIISEGVRLHGEVFTPANAPAGRKLPAVVMAHGWGGTAAGLRNDAADIARAGYFVLTFDYRGWGESGSNVVLVDREPLHTPGEAAPFTAQVKPLRELLLSKVPQGSGPDEAKRERSWFTVDFVGEAGDRTVRTRVSGGDPGYTETAKMLSESALCLLLDDNPPTAGQVTPAQAMGEALLARLQAAGIEFAVVG